jgi:hypothetical protein
MALAKVVEFVDIRAPRAEVYDILVDLKRRVQLSPLWGILQIDRVSENYPREGSDFQMSIRNNAEYPPYRTVITCCNPLRKLAYRLDVRRKSEVTWTLQDTQTGTRVIYEEQFEMDDNEGEEFTGQVRTVVTGWLKNIKHYAELREGWLNRAIKWFLDKYFLNLRKEQRNVVMIILFMQFTSIITFIMAAVAVGVGGLLG